jgi:hypothetical protein
MNDKINPEDSPFDAIEKMSEGNPGALTALTDVLESKGVKDTFEFMMNLDLRRVYGSKIWIGYKDYCNQDADQFHKFVMDDNEELFNYIEKESQE